MSKQETIQHLTDLMGVISNAYWKGRLGERNTDETGNDGVICGELWVHEDGDEHSAAISIDLYNFGGDGKDVCDGLHDCTITFDDGTTATGWLFCMCYDPDDPVTSLVFEFTLNDDDDSDGTCDIDIDPEDVPEEVLKNITAWLEGVFQRMPRIITTKRGCFRIEDDGETLQAVSCNNSDFYFTFAHGTTEDEMIADIEKEFNANNSDGDEE